MLLILHICKDDMPTGPETLHAIAGPEPEYSV